MDKASAKEVLFEGLKEHDRWAQKAFFNSIFPWLCKCSFNIVRNKEDAEDIAIDRFEICLSNVRNMNGYAHLVDYLFKSTRNSSLNYLRDKGKWKKRRVDPIYLNEVPDNATMNEIMKYEMEEDLKSHMADENEINQAVARMAFVEELSNSEIADLLGITEKSVRDRKSRMRPGLKDAFKKGGLFIFLLISTNSMPCSEMKNNFKKRAFPMRQNPAKPGVENNKDLNNQAINTYQYDANQHLNH
jgi:RNA polymerase sigma factor (sigma-70 family)